MFSLSDTAAAFDKGKSNLELSTVHLFASGL